jgi:hypothetical protein
MTAKSEEQCAVFGYPRKNAFNTLERPQETRLPPHVFEIFVIYDSRDTAELLQGY